MLDIQERFISHVVPVSRVMVSASPLSQARVRQIKTVTNYPQTTVCFPSVQDMTITFSIICLILMIKK